MNDFERRLLDVMQNSNYIAAVARSNANILGIDTFSYNLGPNQGLAAVPALGSASALAQIQADSDFALTYMSASVVQAGVINTLPVATIQVTDTGTGKTFYSAPTLIGLVTGNLGFPFLLPSPRVIAPNVNLKVDVTNVVAGAVAMDFFITFIGARIYYGS